MAREVCSISETCIKNCIDNCNKFCTISFDVRLAATTIEILGRVYKQKRIRFGELWMVECLIIWRMNRRLNERCRRGCWFSFSHLNRFNMHTSVNKKVNHFLGEWIAINMCSMLTCNTSRVDTTAAAHLCTFFMSRFAQVFSIKLKLLPAQVYTHMERSSSC